MDESLWVWGLFGALVLAMLALDLGALRRTDGEQSLRSAILWSAAWIGLGLGFGGIVFALYGAEPALTYYTAYALEKSLSIDNIFVFVLIFAELQIPAAEQRRVLYWGVLGALIMRAIFIALGVFLLARFYWIIYPFAALVLFAAVRILFGQEKEREVVRQRLRCLAAPGLRVSSRSRQCCGGIASGCSSTGASWRPHCSSRSCWSR